VQNFSFFFKIHHFVPQGLYSYDLIVFTSFLVCPIGQVAIGPCVNLRCPTGYTCIGTPPNTQCCGFPQGSTNLAFSKLGRYISCPLIDSVGPCIAGNCPTGYLCDTENEDSEKLCCPDFEEPLAAIAPCENTVPRCPKGIKNRFTFTREPRQLMARFYQNFARHA
jgi:hypothetical protein